MKMFLSLLPVVFACSCTAYDHSATAANGNTERDRIFQLGGAIDHHGSDGSGATVGNEKSFSDAMTAAVGVGASMAQVATQKAKELTTRSIDANATAAAIAKTKADAAAAAAKTAAQSATTSEAIKAGAVVNPITVNPP